MKKSAILIVEDDKDIMDANSTALELVGYNIIRAYKISEARKIIEKYKPDLVILDIMLPDGSGLDFCQELRNYIGIRVLLLSALNTKNDVLNGLKAGGDDYITKPYNMEELVLRVEALLRRGKVFLHKEAKETNYQTHKDRLVLNNISRRAFLDGKDLLLKPKEYTLLLILMDNIGSTILSKHLFEKVWGINIDEDSTTVKVHISRIRNKLGENSPIKIIAERGKGYRVEYI